MRRVTKENLIVQIDRLRKIKDEQGQLSMYSEYTLQAFEMLLATMEVELVVPEEAYSDDCPELYPSQPDAWAAGWNSCRAAMLNRK